MASNGLTGKGKVIFEEVCRKRPWTVDIKMMQLQTALVDCEMPQKGYTRKWGQTWQGGQNTGWKTRPGVFERVQWNDINFAQTHQKASYAGSCCAAFFASLPHWERRYCVPLTQQDSANIATPRQDITLHSVLYKELACWALQGATVWLTWSVCSPSHKATRFES